MLSRNHLMLLCFIQLLSLPAVGIASPGNEKFHVMADFYKTVRNQLSAQSSSTKTRQFHVSTDADFIRAARKKTTADGDEVCQKFTVNNMAEAIEKIAWEQNFRIESIDLQIMLKEWKSLMESNHFWLCESVSLNELTQQAHYVHSYVFEKNARSIAKMIWQFATWWDIPAEGHTY